MKKLFYVLMIAIALVAVSCGPKKAKVEKECEKTCVDSTAACTEVVDTVAVQ
jgi:hypothetical protein